MMQVQPATDGGHSAQSAEASAVPPGPAAKSSREAGGTTAPATTIPVPIACTKDGASTLAAPGSNAGGRSITGYPGIDVAIVATLGWAVTHFFAVRREIRKEKRAEVDSCCKMCADLLVKARSYYSVSGGDAEARTYAAEIRFDFQRLLKRCERLQKWDRCFELRGSLDRLMESLTGGEFDSARRKAFAVDSPVLVTIENDIHSLMDSLEAGFGKKFG